MTDKRKSKQQPVDALIEKYVQTASWEIKVTDLNNRDSVFHLLPEEVLSLVQGMPGFVMAVDREHNIRYINHTVAELSVEDILGKSVYDFIVPEFHNIARDCITSVFETGQSMLYEAIGPGENNTNAWYENRASAIRRDDSIVAVAIVGTDFSLRRKIQEQLKIFSLLVEQGINSVAVLDKDEVIQYANPTLYEGYGLTSEEFIGKNWRSIISEHSTLWKEYPNIIEMVLHKGKVWRKEISSKNRDGEVIWRDATIFPVRNDRGDLCYAAYISQDITERKKAEEALRESEERYAAVVRQIKDGIVMIQDWVVVHAVSEQGHIFGYSSEEVIGKYFLDYISPESKDEVAEKYRKRLAGEEVSNRSEFKVICKDGLIRDVETSGGLIQANGHYATVIVFHDITERKRTEQELYESEQKYRTLVETALEGIWFIDANATTIFVNQHMADMLGYSIDEMIGTSLFNYMDESGRYIALQHLEQRKQGIREQHDFEFLRKDGTRIYTSLQAGPLIDEYGHYRGAVASVSDITERKNAENILRDSEEKHRLILDNAEVAISYYDVDGTVRLFNKVAARIMGGSPDDFVGRSFFTLIPNAADENRKRFRMVVETGRGMKREDNLALPSGKRWFSSSLEPVKDRDGNVRGIQIISSDITGYKNAEKELKKAQSLLDETQRMAAISSWEFDPVTNEMVWSEELTYLIGCANQKADASYDVLASLVHPEDKKYFMSVREKAMKIDAGGPYFFRIVQKDGSIRYIESKTKKVYDDKGVSFKVIGFMQDVTERKMAEKALYESEEKYRTLFEGSTNPITLLDRNGVILMINPTGARNLGMSAEECVGKSVFDLSLGLDDSYRLMYQQVVDYGVEISREDYIDLPSKKRWFLSLNQPVIDRDGRRYGVQVISYDITERKNAEKELENYSKNLEKMVKRRTSELVAVNEKLELEIEERKQIEGRLREYYEKEKSLRQQLESEINKRIEFTRALAHELKTPLTSVLMSSQALSSELKQEPYLSLAKNINRGALNLNDRIDELLDIAKGEVGMLQLRARSLDIRRLLEEAIEDVAPLANSRGLLIRIELAPVLPNIWADGVRTKQIVMNLLNNALIFTPEGGEIVLKARETNGHLLVEVRDSGPGISSRELKRIFEPYQCMRNDREGHGGLGLGLALCKSLVTLHGGEIWAVNNEDRGSTFTFTLPLQHEKELYSTNWFG